MTTRKHNERQLRHERIITNRAEVHARNLHARREKAREEAREKARRERMKRKPEPRLAELWDAEKEVMAANDVGLAWCWTVAAEVSRLVAATRCEVEIRVPERGQRVRTVRPGVLLTGAGTSRIFGGPERDWRFARNLSWKPGDFGPRVGPW